MTALKTIVLAAAVIVLIPDFAQAEETVPQPPTCNEQFIADFDLTQNSFLAVGQAIDSKSDDHVYRTSIVSALNACHAFVEKYVKIDPTTAQWTGETCVRGAQLVEPQAHKAECDYLQRLLDRADVSLTQ